MNRLVLAFDTSTEVCALALGRRQEDGTVVLVAAEDFDAPRAAMSRLLPSVALLLARAGVDRREVGEVVVGRGPGSFTGVRIGVATAKGMAQGLGVALFGVGTLDAVAWGFPEFEGVLGVLGDAMRGEVYPALFRVVDGRPVRLGADRVARPEQVAEEWSALGEPLTLAGNALAKHEEVFLATLGARAAVASPDRWRVTGGGLLKSYEAALAADEEDAGDVGALLPIYTRLSDAEQAEHMREGRAADAAPSSGVHGPTRPAGTRRDNAAG